MLETEIKKLTAAVTRLADLMEQQPEAEAPEAEAPEAPEAEAPETEAPEAPEAPKPTPEVENETIYEVSDIKSMALAISRKDRSKQKDIKAKLAEHDAKVATDLEGEALQVVGAWLAELSEEVGA
jgi:hypothetical protein